MARVFISYSHQDEAWKNRVVKQLGVLANEGLEVWDDRKIAAGADWADDIASTIAACDVAVLLISADFLTSRFILGDEVPPLLQRRQEEGIRVIPLIVSSCAWKRIAWLKTIQARPMDGKPLSGMKKHGADSALAALAEEIAELLSPGLSTGTAPAETTGTIGKKPFPAAGKTQANVPPRIGAAAVPVQFNEHFPKGAQHFFGRGAELRLLDDAWIDADAHVVTLIAAGGAGKTSALLRWLGNMRRDGWRGAERVFGWSFYSQGTRESGEASEDAFLARALEFFAVPHDSALHAADKGRLLAGALAAQRCLLLLDGVEPLQYPPGALAGRLRAPGIETLLRQLALTGHPGLCVVTSRERLQDLAEFERGRSHSEGCVLRRDLGNLGTSDGAKLLHAQGANKAGKTAIAPSDDELKAAVEKVRGHALTLALLGRYLAKAHGGNIRKASQVRFVKADQDGHAFKVMAAYEKWLAGGGEASRRELAALRLLGYFDRPATRENLAALRAVPAIVGLTEALQEVDDEAWAITLANLVEGGLAEVDDATGSVDAHPLVREYLAETLKKHQPDAWKEGHRRLYEQLKASVPHRPEGLTALQPLYQAVAHGCQAGLWQEACAEVYRDRILRGTGNDGFYSTNRLGAFGADLGAVACFFVEPWRRPAPELSAGDQAWLLNQAAFRLRALGRLEEALAPMRTGAEMRVKQEDCENAAISYANLSQLQLSLGRGLEAVADARRAVDYADLSDVAFQRMSNRAALADALHQRGEAAAAAQHFAEAEAMQAEAQPKYPLLYSLQGFLYCDLLLAGVGERAAWQGPGEGAEHCEEVAKRGRKMFEWRVPSDSLVDIAIEHLTLARCALYADLLQGRPPGATAQSETEQAVAGLRAAGNMGHIPRGLLTRAWLLQRLGKTAAAAADLDEAEQIARRGAMKLHLADIALTRARLFHDRKALTEARRLIEECGYGRRLPELEDAEAAAAAWNPSPSRRPDAAAGRPIDLALAQEKSS